jgi:hypothetical protein
MLSMDFDDPKPKAERRKQQLIYLRPSLKVAIDAECARLGQNRSEWVERAIVAALVRLVRKEKA